jgi:hypothetical protein
MDLKDTEGDQYGLRRHVVIDGLYSGLPTCVTTTGEVADLDLRFGVDGDPQRVRVGGRSGTGGSDVLEDGVGFGDLFSGRAFNTRRSR